MLVGIPKGERPLENPKPTSVDYFKTDLEGEDMVWTVLNLLCIGASAGPSGRAV